MKRNQWTTNFREDLRKQVNITAAELEVKPNHVLEIAYVVLKLNLEHKNNIVKEQVKEILKDYKEGK